MNNKWHLYMSFLKSIIRIISIIIAIKNNNWLFMAFGFLFAEILGTLEEVKDER